ncbi:hypothetical protein C1N55_02260 [Lysinibacillus sp. SGAir0095]|nr:hypothetical protein C1N55_02260 [Lysinibacillus sp. SGAir0095]
MADMGTIIMIMTAMEEGLEEEDHVISTRFSHSSLFIQSTHRTIATHTITDHTTDLMATNSGILRAL